EERGRLRKPEHDRGRDRGFPARGPGDLVGLLPHLSHELERIKLRHVQYFTAGLSPQRCQHIGTRGPTVKDEAGKADPFWERSLRKSVTGPLGDPRYLKPRQPDVNRRI